MKIVNVIGGLGNQMFQYAFYLALKNKYANEIIKLNTSAFHNYGKHNCYELDKVFDIDAEYATMKEVSMIAYPYKTYRLWQIGNHLLPQRKTMLKEVIFGRFYKEAFERSGSCFYDGYWQNEKYFTNIRDKIIATFTPKGIDLYNAEWGHQMNSTDSVSIHIRRGDYLKKKPYKGICEVNYYKRAIETILGKTHIDSFYIFTNDLAWCQENIVPLFMGKKYSLIDWNKGGDSYKDLYLMTQCHHNIIANSSFSWWGAWLNQHKGKIVITPKIWINKKNNEFTFPNEWIKL